MRKVHSGPESGADGSDYTIEGEPRPRKTSAEKNCGSHEFGAGNADYLVEGEQSRRKILMA